MSISKPLRHAAVLTTLAAATFATTGCKDGGGLSGLLISNEQEVEIGSGVDVEIEKEYKILVDTDPVAVWARQLVEQMVPASNDYRKSSEFGGYKVEVLYDNSLVNAFAAPGGYVYLASGLILSAGSCAEVAGVVGHELAHVTQRHSVKKLTKSSIFSSLAGIILDEGITQTVVNAAYSVLLNTSFSRRDESESDKVGSDIMYQSGYNPYALADMFETLKEQSGGGGGKLMAFLSSHPDPGNRATTIRTRVGKDWPQVVEGDGSEYLYDCVGTTLTLSEVRSRLNAGTVTVRTGTGTAPTTTP